MLFRSINLNDGTIVVVAGSFAAETYEFNLIPKRPSGFVNEGRIISFELWLKKSLPQYPVVTLFDSRLLMDGAVLPRVTCALHLRSQPDQADIRSLFVVVFQDDLLDDISKENMERIQSVEWAKSAKGYRP